MTSKKGNKESVTLQEDEHELWLSPNMNRQISSVYPDWGIKCEVIELHELVYLLGKLTMRETP